MRKVSVKNKLDEKGRDEKRIDEKGKDEKNIGRERSG